MKNSKRWRLKVHEVIYGTHTPAGKLFDILLLILILYSVIIAMMESVPWFDNKYHKFLNVSEWAITILFTIEYILRILCISRPKKYIFSFFGIVDFLSTIPKYLSLFLVGSQYITAFRILRLLRIFRILKLVSFVGEANNLIRALNASKAKIFIFIFFMLIMSIILGTVMFIVEGPDNGYDDIPHSVYWTVVTLTTVGYGDISPHTPLGQFIATLIMLIGYGIIAVPTGIISAEYVAGMERKKNMDDITPCSSCGLEIIPIESRYCRHCGNKLMDN